MGTYMIGYDLHEGENYKNLEDAIKNLGSWWHCLDSTWLVVHPGNAKTIIDILAPHVLSPGKPGGDRLLVVRLTSDGAWTLSFSEDCRLWLQNNLKD